MFLPEVTNRIKRCADTPDARDHGPQLLLSDDNKQRGALNSLDLVGSTAQLREDNRICIWLEDVWSER